MSDSMVARLTVASIPWTGTAGSEDDWGETGHWGFMRACPARPGSDPARHRPDTGTDPALDTRPSSIERAR
jgi:hypothetical protein